jgi:hypothetical protein
LDFNYQDFVPLRYALQLMDSAKLELQQSQDSGNGNGNVVTRLDGKLSLETVNSFSADHAESTGTACGSGYERPFVPGFSGSGRAGFFVCYAKAHWKNNGAGGLDQAGDRRSASFWDP